MQVVKLCQRQDGKLGVNAALFRQLIRSATSIGANVEEAQAAQSRSDFVNKISIALKEARETYYWLRLCGAAEVVPEDRLRSLQGEAHELMRILGAIIVSARKPKV